MLDLERIDNYRKLFAVVENAKYKAYKSINNC